MTETTETTSVVPSANDVPFNLILAPSRKIALQIAKHYHLDHLHFLTHGEVISDLLNRACDVMTLVTIQDRGWLKSLLNDMEDNAPMVWRNIESSVLGYRIDERRRFFVIADNFEGTVEQALETGHLRPYTDGFLVPAPWRKTQFPKLLSSVEERYGIKPVPVSKIETISIKLAAEPDGTIKLTHQFRRHTTITSDSTGKIIPPAVLTRTIEMDEESTALSLYLTLRQGMELEGRLLLPSHWAKCVRSGPFGFEEVKQRWLEGEGSFIDKPVAENLFYLMTYEGDTETEKTDHNRLREIHQQLHFEKIPEGVFRNYAPSPRNFW